MILSSEMLEELSRKTFKKQKIEILISTGGYMSLPLCFAAKIFGIKIFLLEPNMVIGRANKFFLNFCEKIICYSNNIIKFPNKYKNKIAISNPLIRNKYYKKNSKENIDKIFTKFPKLFAMQSSIVLKKPINYGKTKCISSKARYESCYRTSIAIVHEVMFN